MDIQTSTSWTEALDKRTALAGVAKMSGATLELQYIETIPKLYKYKPKTTKISVVTGNEKQKMDAKKQYKAAKKLHNHEKRHLVWQCIKDCHKHSLLKKQAKLVYKLSK